MLLFIGGPEIIVILLFIVIFFGSSKIPSLARSLGKTIREVKDASNEIKKEIRDSANEVKDDIEKKLIMLSLLLNLRIFSFIFWW